MNIWIWSLCVSIIDGLQEITDFIIIKFIDKYGCIYDGNIKYGEKIYYFKRMFKNSKK